MDVRESPVSWHRFISARPLKSASGSERERKRERKRKRALLIDRRATLDIRGRQPQGKARVLPSTAVDPTESPPPAPAPLDPRRARDKTQERERKREREVGDCTRGAWCRRSASGDDDGLPSALRRARDGARRGLGGCGPPETARGSLDSRATPGVRCGGARGPPVRGCPTSAEIPGSLAAPSSIPMRVREFGRVRGRRPLPPPNTHAPRRDRGLSRSLALSLSRSLALSLARSPPRLTPGGRSQSILARGLLRKARLD